MNLPLPEEQVRYWIESKGCTYVLDSIYVSNIEQQNFGESKTYLNKWLGDTSFLQIVHYPEDKIDEQMYLTHYYDHNFSLRADVQKRTLKGRYLRIIFAYEFKEQLETVQDHFIHATNYLRLRYGLGAALECAGTATRNLITREISFTSEYSAPITTHGDGRAKNSFFENGAQADVVSIDTSTLKADASILLDEALKDHNPHLRFLLLWMVLEAQIGNGKKRKNFCENEFSSPTISNEMERLHKIRSNLTHSLEKIPHQDLSIDNIMELIRISTLPDSPQRQKLVDIIEAKLKKPIG